jgi:hypothetical protein
MRFSRVRRQGRVARATPLALGLVVAVVGSACRGPVAPLDVGSKDVALDLLLGAKKAVAGAPVPPASLALQPNGSPFSLTQFVTDPPLPRLPRRPKAAKAANCDVDPLAVPSAVAPNYIVLPPAEQTYSYRANGSFSAANVATGVGQHVAAPPTATVKVQNRKLFETVLSSTWDVAVTLGAATTTTSYRTLYIGYDELAAQLIGPPPATAPTPAALWGTADDTAQGGQRVNPRVTTPKTGQSLPPYPEGPGSAVQGNDHPLSAGLYITKVQGSGDTVPFTPPAPGILLAKYPLAVGSSIDSTATDGTTTMTFHSTIGQKATVYACGTPLDSWTIELTNGRVATANGPQVVEFSATYQVGTQYGGLILSDVTAVSGNQGATHVERQLSTSITEEPKVF